LVNARSGDLRSRLTRHDRAGCRIAEFDVAYDDVRNGYGVDFVTPPASASRGRKIGSYFRIRERVLDQSGCGLGGLRQQQPDIRRHDNIILDAGITVGLVKASQDFGVITGISLRF